MVWAIMSILDNLSEHGFWFENKIVLRYHASTHSQNGSEKSQIKQNSPILCNFKPKEQFWIDKGHENQNRCKRTRNKCHKPRQLRCLCFGKLINVFRGKLVTEIKTFLEDVIQLVEFSKFPFGEKSV